MEIVMMSVMQNDEFYDMYLLIGVLGFMKIL